MPLEFCNEYDELRELSRAESVYNEAPPDQVDSAFEKYVEALRRFNELKPRTAEAAQTHGG